MKYLVQAFLSCILYTIFLSPTKVYASDEIKGTYETAELVQEIRIEKIDTRADRLNKYLKAHNSPMADAASYFVKEADRLGLDWKLVAAIAGNESYFGIYIPENSYNGWGWAVYTGMSYGAAFANWENGITTVSEGLKTNYVDKGLKTLADIGQKYAADPQWSWKVSHFMEEIDAFTIYERDERLLALSL